jgi:hypothetical protein
VDLPEDHLRLRAVDGPPGADAPLERAADAGVEIGGRRILSSKIATTRRPGAALSIGTISAAKIAASGSGRRRARGSDR